MQLPTDMLHAGGGDAIIWLILAAVWGLIQFLGSRAKGKKSRPPPIRRTGEDDVPVELQRFLESVTGAPVSRSDFRITSPPEIRPAAIQKPIPRRQVRHTPPPPAPTPPAVSAVPEPTPIIPTEAATVIIQQGKRMVLPKVMPSQRSMRLPIMIKWFGVHQTADVSIVKPDLHSKQALKHAVLSRMILGPPKALVMLALFFAATVGLLPHANAQSSPIPYKTPRETQPEDLITPEINFDATAPTDGSIPEQADTALSDTNDMVVTGTDTGLPARIMSPGQVKLREAQELIAEKEFTQAIPRLEWIVNNEPTLLRAWETLGWAYWNVGRKDDMIQLWKRLESIVPFSPLSHNLLAKAYVSQGHMRFAEEHLRKSLDLDPLQFETRFSLARVILWQGRAEESIPMFRDLLKERPDRTDIQLQLARALDADRQYEESLELWNAAWQSDPTNVTYLVHEAIARLRAGDLETAREKAHQAIEMDENNLLAWIVLADAAEYGSKPSDAIPELRAIIDKTTDPNLKLSFYNRLILLRLRMYRIDPIAYPLHTIIEETGQALEIDPRNVNFLLLQAELYLMNGNYAAAEKRYLEVEEKYNPHNRRAEHGLFQTYLAWHRYELADQYLTKAEQFDPHDPYRYFYRALFELGRGQYQEAYAALDRLEYEGARGSVFALLYHGLTTSEYMTAPSARRFREHMLALKKAGYRFVTPEEIPAYFDSLKDPPKKRRRNWMQNWLRSMKSALSDEDVEGPTLEDVTPEKVVCVTFDDGLRSSFRWATPVAEELDIMFSMHIPVGNILNYDPSICSWDEMRSFKETGRWSFGSHLIDASTPAPVDREGYLVRPLPNRLWKPSKDRPETLMEYLLRVQREIKMSWEMIRDELDFTEANVPYMAYPMGDLGQEDFCNVNKAITSILLESDLVYHLAFRQSQFGYSVKGDTPLLYQRYEMEHWEDGKDVLRFAFEKNPVFLARRMRAEIAALQGKPYLAMRMIDLLKRDGCPDETLNNLNEYIARNLADKIPQPAQTERVESKKTAARIQFKELYIGGGYEYMHDNADTKETLYTAKAGLNVTPQLTVEAEGAIGEYEYTYQDWETVAYRTRETNSSTTITTTDSDQTGEETTVTETTTITDVKKYTNIIHRTTFEADERRLAVVGNYKTSEGSVFSAGVLLKQYESDTPGNQVDGESFVGFSIDYYWKPTLVTEAAWRFERNCFPTLIELVEYYALSVQGQWDVSDSWEVNGAGTFQRNSDDNSMLTMRLDSLWQVSEPQGIYAGIRGQFANAEEKREYYWTPHWQQRLFLVGRIRRNYLQAYFEGEVRFGITREKGWQEDVDRYQQNVAQADLYGYYPGEDPDKDWEGIMGCTLALRKKFWKHFELGIMGSINDLPDYTERNLKLNLTCHF